MTHGDNVGRDKLRQFIERIERLEKDKKAVMEDIKEVFAEAKGEGYDAKIIRRVIRERKKERHERVEEQMVFDLYWEAIEGLLTKAETAKAGLAAD